LGSVVSVDDTAIGQYISKKLVFEDADFDDTIETAVTGWTQNSGQSCIAAKCLFVHTDIYNDFLDQMSALTVGDPTDP